MCIMHVWHMGDSFFNVVGDPSQPSYDVQYEVPGAEGEFSGVLIQISTILSVIYYIW